MKSKTIDGYQMYAFDIQSLKKRKQEQARQTTEGLCYLTIIALICAVLNITHLEAKGSVNEFIEDAGSFIHIISN